MNCVDANTEANVLQDSDVTVCLAYTVYTKANGNVTIIFFSTI